MDLNENWVLAELNAFGSPLSDFWVESICGINARIPWMDEIHGQRFFSVLILGEGRATLEVNTTCLELCGPVLVFLMPGDVSRFVAECCQGYLVCFNEKFFSFRYNENRLNRFCFLSPDSCRHICMDRSLWIRLTFLLENMVCELQMTDLQSVSMLRSYLNILLCETERCFPMDSREPNMPMDHKELKLNSFLACVEESFVREKKPSYYAQHLHMTTNYLNRICKDRLGKSSSRLIQERVLREAEKLLKHTAMSVSEIAGRLGFDSVSYFVAFYRKNSGMTPESFRKSKSGI